MGTMLASQLILRAATILNDPSYEVWTQDELLRWLNDAQLEVVKHVPEANVVEEVVSLVAGTRQSIPTGGLRLLDVIRWGNRSSPGKAIKLMRREDLDNLLPAWHSTAIASSEFLYYVYDPRTPRTFFVYPSASANASVEIAYSKMPTSLASISSAISIDDIYSPAMVDYMVYRAQCKDREDQGRGPQLAAAFYAAFMQSLGVQSQMTAVLDPSKHTDEFVRHPKTM